MTNRERRPWHASDDLVTRYAGGVLPEADAWSLEKHLEGCTGCASRVSAAVRDTAAGAVLAQVRAAVLDATPAPEAALSVIPEQTPEAAPSAVPEQTPAPAAVVPAGRLSAGAADRSTLSGRAADRSALSGRAADRSALTDRPAGKSALSARPAGKSALSRPARLLWAAGPAVRGAWLPAVLGVALGALALSYGAGVPGMRALLLAIAPVLPVAGVALSYGPHADPLHEVAAATPGGGLRLALTRTVAVLAVSLPLLTFAGLLLPASGAPAAAAWLLPGLALALASLALATFVGCRAAAGVTGGGWLCAVLAPMAVAPTGTATAELAEQLSRCLDGTAAQGAWAAAAVVSAVLLGARRPAYDRPLRP
ncbi:zf-HC2 domain-containing protein [Streptomyces actinomycinicus]|uniref:Zf-HC2 domain-containing protein n=1 Tax=Streptomyces actinomycinicus TaxID=1695166 RepID=A0A937EEF6_9ACTN|nr:zf-HC2 domain-containing protein [Streptomyces actinomycinicus]MBL1080644.1 zf-HC2 domain-containing protein [Streptomyces actinomycinicus]